MTLKWPHQCQGRPPMPSPNALGSYRKRSNNSVILELRVASWVNVVEQVSCICGRSLVVKWRLLIGSRQRMIDMWSRPLFGIWLDDWQHDGWVSRLMLWYDPPSFETPWMSRMYIHFFTNLYCYFKILIWFVLYMYFYLKNELWFSVYVTNFYFSSI